VIAALSASVNSTPARYRGGSVGLGSSNLAQAIVPRNRIMKLSVGMLTRTRWNRKETAEILGISYKALLYKIKENGLDKAS